MPYQARFHHGEYVAIDYTPTSAVAAGDVVVLNVAAGITCGIAHLNIAANALGALATGGGVYEVKNINNAANWTKVYWDNTADGVTTTAAGNAVFGAIVSGGGGGANSQCYAKHEPFV
jgi:Uncharacterized conserved protein (DUF2190)